MIKTQAVRPPEGYSPTLKKGIAWCPYCGKEMPFAYDGRVDSARCVECGISERDYYVRLFNGLCDKGDRMISAFVQAVKKSRRKYKKPFFWQSEQEPEKKTCAKCKGDFTPSGKRQVYCLKCGEEVKREAAKERKRRQREREKSRPAGAQK